MGLGGLRPSDTLDNNQSQPSEEMKEDGEVGDFKRKWLKTGHTAVNTYRASMADGAGWINCISSRRVIPGHGPDHMEGQAPGRGILHGNTFNKPETGTKKDHTYGELMTSQKSGVHMGL